MLNPVMLSARNRTYRLFGDNGAAERMTRSGSRQAMV